MRAKALKIRKEGIIPAKRASKTRNNTEKRSVCSHRTFLCVTSPINVHKEAFFCVNCSHEGFAELKLFARRLRCAYFVFVKVRLCSRTRYLSKIDVRELHFTLRGREARVAGPNPYMYGHLTPSRARNRRRLVRTRRYGRATALQKRSGFGLCIQRATPSADPPVTPAGVIDVTALSRNHSSLTARLAGRSSPKLASGDP